MIFKTDVEFTLTYTVKKIISRLPSGAYLLDVKVKSFEGYPKKAGFPKQMEAIGYFSLVNKGDTFKQSVRFSDSERFGYRFNLLGVPEVILPATSKEVAKYLKEHIRGLGEKGAKAIAEKLGPSAITYIPEHPDSLEDIPNINKKTKEAVVDWCTKNAYCEAVITYLYQQGVPVDTAKALYERFGTLTINQINDRPYSLYEAGTMPFRYTEQIAKNLGFSWDCEERLLCAIRAAMDDRIESHGDSCVLKDNIIDIAETYLSRSKNYDYFSCREDSQSVFSEKRYKGAIKKLVDIGEIVEVRRRSKNRTNIYCYRKATYFCEKDAAKRVIELLQRKPPIEASATTIRDYLKETHEGLADEQVEGIITAATHGFSVLTGGPGTGKTFTMKALVETLKHFKPSIRIIQAAPTSKAASRMREMTGVESDTIHSTFKIGTSDGIHNGDEDFILDADFVIIDESSMIGSELFDKMLNKVSDSVRFLFVGDSAQLPSIEYGDVLHSLVMSKLTGVPRIELKRVHRQSQNSMVVTNAHIIRNQNIDEILNMQFRKKDFELIEAKSETDACDVVVNVVKKLFERRVLLDDILVLTPVHRTLCGTDALNSRLREMLNVDAKDGKKCYAVDDTKVFYEGDRVINTRNFTVLNEDGEKIKVRNGDKGYIVGITDKTIDVEREDEGDIITFTRGKIDYLDLAYAVTVHKSQGSEAEYVILPCLNSRTHQRMLTRALLYTAVTRTKRKFICIGTKDAFVNACLPDTRTLEEQRAGIANDPDKRLTLLSVFLVDNAQKAGLIA